MAFGKTAGGGMAFASGMRGAEKPNMDADSAGESMAAQEPDGGDYGHIVAQHVHGPDENGHHHLNLTTLSEHLSKHGGAHKR